MFKESGPKNNTETREEKKENFASVRESLQKLFKYLDPDAKKGLKVVQEKSGKDDVDDFSHRIMNKYYDSAGKLVLIEETKSDAIQGESGSIWNKHEEYEYDSQDKINEIRYTVDSNNSSDSDDYYDLHKIGKIELAYKDGKISKAICKEAINSSSSTWLGEKEQRIVNTRIFEVVYDSNGAVEKIFESGKVIKEIIKGEKGSEEKSYSKLIFDKKQEPDNTDDPFQIIKKSLDIEEIYY